MNAVSTTQPSPRRYRRRILGWGAAGVLMLFAIGGLILVNRVEDDLEARVIALFDEVGIGPVTASFSGQDGTLSCSGPVSIPDDVLSSSRNLWGVSSLDVDASCTPEPGEGSNSADLEPSTDGAAVPGSGPGSDAAGTSATVTADLDTVADVIANDSQFSTLANLLGGGGMIETLQGAGPFTVFAPTNEAFEELGPEVIAGLERDPELLTNVLTHHVAAGAVLSRDLVSGVVQMIDASTITVDKSDGITITDTAAGTTGSVPAMITEADLVGSNGVVHAIDHVLVGTLVNDDIDVAAMIAAELVDGQLTLRGATATEAQANQLRSAALSQLDQANVVDELVIDPTITVGDDAITALASLVEAMPPNLVTGTAELKEGSLFVTGMYLGPDERAALDTVVASLGDVAVILDLTERTTASEADAVTLEADLNALVTASPILFEPNSTTISADSAAVLDRVAAQANRIAGVAIEIRGHTDTDGNAESNQALSEGRAAAVRSALVDRGLDAESLTTAGLGGTVPIVDSSGVEDKAASRRVEFVVIVQ